MFNIISSSSPPFCCPSDNVSSCESSKNISSLVHSANVSNYSTHSANVSNYSTIEFSRECIIKNTEGLKFLHVNARSLYPKLPKLSLMVKDLNLDCISVNETWLNDTFSDNEIEIPDFTVFRHDRINGSHGGVALCIKTNLSPSKANLPFNTESIWVLIKINSSKLLVSSIYRTPKSPVSYHQLIMQDIELASSLNIDMVIMSDPNYDYLSAAGKLKVSEIENSFLLTKSSKTVPVLP